MARIGIGLTIVVVHVTWNTCRTGFVEKNMRQCSGIAKPSTLWPGNAVLCDFLKSATQDGLQVEGGLSEYRIGVFSHVKMF